eukprot:s2531_g18.t2
MSPMHPGFGPDGNYTACARSRCRSRLRPISCGLSFIGSFQFVLCRYMTFKRLWSMASRSAMPFDWTFSSPAMVRDCLDDDFRAFLDPREPSQVAAVHSALLQVQVQDFDYFKRCVERFRNAARAPGRKLFVVSCLVDSLRSLHEMKEMGTPSSRSENFFDVESKGIQRGDKASWRYFAPLEVVKLYESLQHFGVSDFKLAALVLCIGDASVAEKEPVILGIPLDLQKPEKFADASNCVMFEIHLERGADGAEVDPFKFFEEASHDEAFTTAVLGGVPVHTELDPLQDDYKPAGYRDCLVDSCADSGAAKDNQHLFVCKCCATNFPSRNRLYAHIRSSPSCIKFVEETDAEGFQSLIGNGKELASQVFALMIGIPGMMTRNDLARNLESAFHCVGVGIENIPHQVTDGHLTSDQCPAVALTIFVKMSCSLRGEALLCRLRELLALKMLVLHSCEAVGKSMALQWQQSSLQQHFGYLLPFLALSKPVEDFAQRQEIYRRFKQALNHVQKTWQSTEMPQKDDAQALQLKMTQRLSFGSEYVLIKVVGEISSSTCCMLIARALAHFHGLEWRTSSDIPGIAGLPLPSGLVYLEGQRFPQLEKKHGPLFGRSCLPWGEAMTLANWRSELQRRLVNGVDWPKDGKSTFRVPNHLELMKKVGSGAYGCVASFKDKKTGDTMAVKKITNAFDDLVDGKRILREVKLLRQLDHDNIIRILDMYPPAGPDFEDIYIVTDLMETDLHRVIYSKQPLTEEHHQYFVHQVLRGLAYLHSASIVHRDIKPSNLLVNKNCDLKICDFGLARVLATESDEAAGRTDYVVTRWYRAPEVMLHSAEYTVAIDVWAVGCIMCELINRKPLFAGKDHVDQIRKIISTLGTPTEAESLWLPEGGTARGFLAKCPAAPKVNWKQALPTASENAIEVVSKMVTFDPTVRISVADTLRLKYFDHLFDEEDMVHDTCNKKIDWSFDNFEPTKPLLQSYVYCELASFHPEIVERDKDLLAARGIDKLLNAGKQPKADPPRSL